MEREDIYSRENQTNQRVTPRRRRYEEESYVPHYSDVRKTKPEIEVKRVSRTQSGYNSAGGQRKSVSGSQSNGPRSAGGYASGSRPSGHVTSTGKAPAKKTVPNKKKKHIVGRILAIIQAILSIVVLGLVFALDVLPTKFAVLIAVLLLVLWIFAFFSQYTKKAHIAGKIESLIVSILLILGTYYLSVTHSFLGEVTGSTVKVDHMVIAVMKDDPAESLADAVDYTFGIQTVLDAENTEKTLAQIEENIGKEINIQVCDSILDQVESLYEGDVDVIVYNEAFIETVFETYPTFNEDIRVLDNVKIETKIEAVVQSDKEVTKEAFTVYLSGTDKYGHISTNGLTDVNILVTVNPKTKQVLLTTTPRDYYVTFPGVSNGAYDKLTHAGNYGVDCSMNTLGELYGIEIDHYVKVNFTSVVKIVEELGGVEVFSEYEFDSIYGYHFEKGMNTITDGEEALAFVRERKNLPGGDNQRGKNQQAMITAMLNKAMSPAILANYAGLLSSLDGNFETSMTTNDIMGLVKKHLDQGGNWNIVSQSVTGFDSEGTCYSSGDYVLYVMEQNPDSVAAAKAQIQQVYNGEILGAAVTE